MELRVLGPVEVIGPDGPVSLGPPQQRAVLARLALEPNATVATGALVDAIWDRPPTSAVNLVHGYISSLRRVLGTDRLLSLRPGYRLVVGDDELDATRFATLIGENRPREALALWRGDPFPELPDLPAAVAEATRLAELRLAAVETALGADVDGGRHVAAVGELEAVLAEHPLRERLWGLLLLALYRSGRQADALRAYQRARTVLRDQLGIEPSRDLQELESAILAQDPRLDPSDQPPRSGIVVLLFTDLVGSTELLDTLGDDESERVRRRHFRLLRDIVRRHGGREVKSLGDGFMVTFTSAVSALACSVAIHVALDSHPDDLEVRIGVHAGEPLVDEEDYFGTPVVMTRRLCDVAPGGTTLVSDVVRGLVRGRGDFVFVPEGSLRLKGLTTPVEAFSVDWRTSVKAPLPMPEHLAAIERRVFAGRTAERERLRSLWHETRAGSGSVVLVSGEPGIGKSRLVAELAFETHAEGAIVLAGFCDEGRLVPFQPFAAIATQCGALAPDLGDLRHPEQLARLSPSFGAASNREPTDLDRDQLFAAAASLLVWMSMQAPVLVVIDDLHWADASSLELLRHLAGTVSKMRVLLVGTYRDTELGRRHPLSDELEKLRRHGRYERLALGGLAEDAVAEMIEAWGLDRPADGLARSLLAETDGVPFFVEECLWHLRESGDDRVPEGVREVVGKRLSVLSDQTNDVLRSAALLGPTFELGVLVALTGVAEDDVLDSLAEAARCHFIVELSVDRYAFAHAIFRTTLYEEFSTSKRVRLHRQAAEVLVRVCPDDVAAIAHHYGEAAPLGVLDEAAVWARRAGLQALERLAYHEAYEWLGRAREDCVDEGLAFELQLDLIRAAICMGDVERARSHFATALEMAERRGEPDAIARVALSVATWGVFSGSDRSGQMLRCAEHAIEGLDGQESALLALMLIRAEYEKAGNLSDRCDAQRAARGLEMARRLDLPMPLLALALENYRYVIWHPDRLDERLTISQEIAALGHAAHDDEWEFVGNFWLSVDTLASGDVAGARRHEEMCAELAARLGQPRFEVLTPFFAARNALLEGRWGEAATFGEESRRIGESSLGTMGPMFHNVRMLRLAYEQGQMREFLVVVEDFFAASAEALAYLPWRAWARAVAGESDAAREDLEWLRQHGYRSPQMLHTVDVSAWCLQAEAATIIDDVRSARDLMALLQPHATEWAVPGPGPVTEGAVSLYLGMLANLLGEHEAAEPVLSAAVKAHRAAGARPLLARTLVQLGSARRGLGDRARALHAEAEARSLAHELILVDVLAGLEGPPGVS